MNASSSGSGGGPANPAPTGCGGPTINLNNGMSQSALQSTISGAPNCALIVFAAGTYNINSTLTIPCNKLTITGPVASPATAVISGSFTGQAFSVDSNCSGVTIEYLHTQNIGILSTDTSNNSNINILHNQCTNIQGNEQCLRFNGSLATSVSGGQLANTVSNVTIEYNTFGDPGSCTAQFAATPTANAGGDCAGVIVGVGEVLNWTVEYNVFNHVEEGFHILNLQGSCCTAGVTESVMVGFTFAYNYVLNWHRIAVEIQAQTPTDSAVFENNVLQDPQNMYWETYGWSFACCQNSFTGLTNGFSPGIIYDSNVVMAGPGSNSANGYAIQMGAEFWGNGAQGTNNLMQGSLCTAINWGYGAGSWAINNNTIQGPLMAAGSSSACPFGPATYIANEEGQSNPPSQSGNVTGPSTSAITSVAPTMSPASGGQTFPLTVTLTDAGYTSGAQPLGNTGIWYTTDGSTPVPGSGTAQYLASGGTFVLPAPATVKAVGMWGTPNQPTSYPAGYGFVPSGVVTAAYSVSGGIKRPAGTASSSNSPTGKLAAAVGAAAELPAGAASAALESVAINPSQPVVAIGSTTQLKAIATFDDGSVKDVTADFGWQSSDGRIMTANGSGTLAGVASGKATISGSYRGLQASVSANSTIGEVVWSDPIVITEGGTYSGNWQSTDAKTPAVTVATTAPVTIENAHIRSLGGLIKTTVAGSNLTVRNSLGVAVNAAVKGQPNGVFLEVASPTRLDVENNYIENAQGGVIVHGYAGNRDGGQTIVIRANRARNMNGLLSDGNGGYLPGEGSNRSQARFIQFDSVQSVPGIDVGWNEVINYPGHSLVDDNIDLYRSGGTANQPLEIHDTYIQGAYPYRPAQDAYTGGGIKTEGRAGDNAQEAPAFNSIHDNQVVGTVNYGIQFAAGHDNVAANNRVISSGLLGDGTKSQPKTWAWPMAQLPAASASMYNNTMRDNLIGWTCWQSSCAQAGYRKDQFFPASPADYSTNSVVAAGQITFDMENNEYQVWLNKLSAAAVSVGPAF